MKNIRTINATKARNTFFALLNKSYTNRQIFLVEKSDIPVAYIFPVTKESSKEARKDKEIRKNLKILEQLDKLHKKMPKSPDSVELIREMRQHGR